MKFLIDSKHGLGDCIHIIPMLKILKQNYPDSYIAIIVNSEAHAELLRLAPVKIDKFFYLNMECTKLNKLIHLIFDIRKEKFDYLILSPITSKYKAMFFACLCGASNNIGEQYQRLTIEYLNKTHRVNRNINLLSSFCTITSHNTNPSLLINNNKFDGFNGMEKLIGICVGGGSPVQYKGLKVYPKAWNNIKELIKKLSELEYKIILFGGSEEKNFLISSELKVKNNLFDFVNKTSISDTVLLASKCNLVIGVDTGVQHIADAVGVNTISIFGPTNPNIVGAYSDKAIFLEKECDCKYCYGTEKYLNCANRKCLNKITADDVLKVIELYYSRVK